MKNYIKPSVETVEFNTTDIIRTSNTLTNEGEGNFISGGGGAAWGVPSTNAANTAAQPIDVFSK